MKRQLRKCGWSNLLQTVQGTTCSLFLFFLLLPAPRAFALVDTNNNSMSDLWEKSHNSNQLFTNLDPQGDLDGDGYTNQDESVAGTGPANGKPPEGFLIAEVTHVPAVYTTPEGGGDPVLVTAEGFLVKFASLPGKRYTILYSPDLSEGSWVSAETAISGTGDDLQLPVSATYTDGTTVPAGFWRVAVTDTDTDGDTLTDAEENQMGTNPLLKDSDADGMDDNVDPEPNVGFPSFTDADGDGIPDEDDSQPDVPAGDPPSISSDMANLSEIFNVAAGDSQAFIVTVENPDGPPPTAANLKLFVAGTPDSASFTPAGANRFSVTWTAWVHAGYPEQVVQNLSVRFQDSRKATAWLELARLDVAEWQGMVAGLTVHYQNTYPLTFSISGHSAGVRLTPAQWSGEYGWGPRWYRGPRSVRFYGRRTYEEAPGPDLGILPIGANMRYPLFILDDTGTPAPPAAPTAPAVTVRDVSDPVQYPHGYWGLNQWTGQIKMDGTGATTLIEPGTRNFIPLPQPDAEDFEYAFNARFLQDGEWGSALSNFFVVPARGWARAMHAVTAADSSTPEQPRVNDWHLSIPVEARIVASTAGSLEYPGLPLDHLQEHHPLFMAPSQWHRIVVKVGPDAAVVARGVRLRLNIGANGTGAAQSGIELKHKATTGFETFTPGEILEGSDLYNKLISQTGLVLFAKLYPTIDRLHRLTLDLLPNNSTLEPLEITKLELVPVDIDDINESATGVDDVSLTADPSDLGYQSKFWIMAPCGNDPSGNSCSDDTQIKIPMEPASKLRMDCTLADCKYRHPVDSTAASPAVPIGQGLASPVRWLGTGAETSDNTPIYKLGEDRKQVELPVRIKTMKRRTVKVAVWPVNRDGMPPLFADEPARAAFETNLNTRLDEIIAYQTNAWFDVDVKASRSSPYLDGTTEEGIRYTLRHGTREKNMIDANRDGGVDINLYLIKNVIYFSGDPADPLSAPLAGSSYPSGDPNSGAYANCAVINMDPTTYTDPLDSAAHEIGHLMVGPGHPDQGGGPAPLQSLAAEEHRKRLMFSDTSAAGRLLVKTEWDKAEKWLKENPDRREQEQQGGN